MDNKQWRIPWELMTEKDEISRPITIDGKEVVHIIDGKHGHKLIIGKGESPWHQWNEFIKYKGVLVSPRDGDFKVSSLAE